MTLGRVLILALLALLVMFLYQKVKRGAAA